MAILTPSILVFLYTQEYRQFVFTELRTDDRRLHRPIDIPERSPFDPLQNSRFAHSLPDWQIRRPSSHLSESPSRVLQPAAETNGYHSGKYIYVTLLWWWRQVRCWNYAGSKQRNQWERALFTLLLVSLYSAYNVQSIYNMYNYLAFLTWRSSWNWRHGDWWQIVSFVTLVKKALLVVLDICSNWIGFMLQNTNVEFRVNDLSSLKPIGLVSLFEWFLSLHILTCFFPSLFRSRGEEKQPVGDGIWPLSSHNHPCARVLTTSTPPWHWYVIPDMTSLF